MSEPISAVIVVYNQIEQLKSCLSSVEGWVSEIIVVDLSSTEDIKSLAEAHHAKYHRLPYTQVVEQIRSRAFALASSDYILYLDADEQISPGLKSKLSKLTCQELDYVFIPRQNYIFGTWVKASRWWPDYQIRFFRPSKVTWPTTLHSQPEAVGTNIKLEADPKVSIIHHNYRTVDEWLEKNLRYARVDAADRLSSGQNFTILTAMKLSVSELISRFFAKGGYTDGMTGLILAILQSFYYFLVYAYYWQAQGYRSNESLDDLRSFPQTWFTHGLSETLFWNSKGKSTLHKIRAKLVRKMIA